MNPRNLYVHFPFCRRKCTYCALYSRVGISQSERDAYVRQLARSLSNMGTVPEQMGTVPLEQMGTVPIETVYFGGGSPALCDLSPLFDVLRDKTSENVEFTVELHPLDVTDDLLRRLKDGGVNRISMGVQSLDDATLAKMGRGYTISEAMCAFAQIRRYFENAGIDMIVGYPGDPYENWEGLRDWGLRHCSVYSLILEEKSILYRQIANSSSVLPRPKNGDSPHSNRDCPRLPDDDTVLNRIADVKRYFAEIGLERYEISNYSVKGYECRHNLAVWRGEDYIGLGAGAFGRVGLMRTQNWGLSPSQNWGLSPFSRGLSPVTETVSVERDRKERTLFRLRTREGLETQDYPEWGQSLARFVSEGLLTREGSIYRLTERGTEVCDTILAELV